MVFHEGGRPLERIIAQACGAGGAHEKGGMMRNKRFAAFFFALVLGCCGVLSGCGVTITAGEEGSAAGSEDETESGADGNTASKSQEDAPADFSAVRAQDDYYGYVNAEYLAGASLDRDYQMSGSFVEAEKLVDSELDEIIGEIAASDGAYAPGTNEQLIRDLHRQLLEWNAEDGGARRALVLEDVARIEGTQTARELVFLASELTARYHTNPFWSFGVAGDVYDAKRYAIYFQQNSELLGETYKSCYQSKSACANVEALIRDCLVETGVPFDEAKERAKGAIRLLLGAISATDFSVEEAPNPADTVTFLSEEEMTELLGHLGCGELLQSFGIEENPYGGVYLQDRAQLAEIGRILTDDHLRALQDLEIASILYSVVDYVDWESGVLDSYARAGYEEPEKLAREYLKTLLDTQLGELYAERYYTGEVAERIEAMCEEIREGYRRLISGADWLSAGTREKLLRKLEGIVFVLGGGEAREISAGDAELIGENALASYWNLNERKYADQIARVGARSGGEAGMTPQTVNACYNPNNTVTITVAILNAPFFDVHASEMANLGGLGMVIAHEVGHAFDSNCIEYDADGRYNPEWIAQEDRAKMEERQERFADYYSAYTILEVYHVDGERTMGENYADLGGMECITSLAGSREELRELFEHYALIWRELGVDTDAIGMLSVDVHSPAKVRVNAVLSSLDAFYEAYEVRPGDGMYAAPEARVRRW